MDLNKYRHQETVTVAAPPEAVYDLIADITRIGEFSPVCSAGEWHDDSQVWFTGTNTTPDRTWATKCRVEVSERGEEFTFINCGMEGDVELVRWSYTFAPNGDVTEVTEAWEVLPGYEAFITGLVPGMDVVEYLDGVKPVTQQGMADTLAKLKVAAEA